MASIKKIQLKALKTFRGMEGQGFEANIYMDNKKIGEVSDWGEGGEFQIVIKPEAEAEFNRRVNEYFAQMKAVDYLSTSDIFLDAIHELLDLEKSFKKQVKKYEKKGGKPWFIRIDLDEFNARTYIVFNNKQISKVLNENEHIRYKVFRSLDDFIIN